MGNNQSSGSKSAMPSSSQPPTSSPTTTTTTAVSSHDAARHLTTAGIPSSRTSKDSSASSSARNILPAQAPHRSAAAPPEPSLAQAQGSTSTASSSRPKSISAASSSLPPVSSLAGSPHNTVPGSHHQPAPVPAAAPIPIAEPSKPVDVPGVGAGTPGFSRTPGINRTDSEMAEAHLIASGSITDMYNARPPRLPLPIEEEVHTPGSPILGPDETAAGGEIPELEHESSDGLTRKSSGISQTTFDDEDSHELRVDRSRPVVPTRIEWNGGGEKVYVTGTIFQWSRKQRLHPVEGKPGCFAGIIYVLPGTHHVRFVVDTIMKTSPDLPTTVDFGNNLVNYIEVSAEMAAQPLAEAAVPGPDGQVKPIVPTATTATTTTAATPSAEEPPKPAKYKAIPPRDSYRRQIPKYLVDFDQAEESPAYQSAVSAIEKLPTPPGLPGFLSKPILNAATLMKDDNSVLNMPNHTVLNHLATSSIKNNVLAVCATTRYRGKYVTTIVYKPTSADEG
ncbi:5-AMP-activated protein kinase, beta subunit, interaction domain protein [Cordyceps fumosorosea ARSEF 2679]|uniref:5-AMP-activated protein kinase, beta subunit, interaction domain protein n=1 Tax=Cordyceps fumosorosea (strain ARSEF 2679) TaxID=1081104 RepID=A0A162MWA4_CORFA|nr:5-AMP-activated protein kinase, beta subunit, interaction domain protein [Cordyceps fumosorosea ARSEF 2679]OAA71599.1 5-AMP-activated protein kinase, beta subunit, interaction domain protein [Cordyceps fumosorosea ARSEF 2679]